MAILKPVSPDADGQRRTRRRRLKNVPVLPALLTLGNLLCGFAAVYFCMRAVFGAGANIDPAGVKTLRNEHFERLLPSFLAIGAWCIFLGMVFDAFDGFVARLSRKASQFGVQLDSLADVVTFGLAPAVLIIALVIQARHLPDPLAPTANRDAPMVTVAPDEEVGDVGPLAVDRVGRVRWMLVAVYVACAAIRLARFNVETHTEESAHRGFKGLPSPAAAGVIASLVVLHEHLVFRRATYGTGAGQAADWIVAAMPVVALVAALLMVSRFDYKHVINVYLRGRRPVGYVVVAMAVLIVLIQHPEITLAAGMCIYALSGPVRRLLHVWRQPEAPPEHHDDAADDQDHGHHAKETG